MSKAVKKAVRADSEPMQAIPEATPNPEMLKQIQKLLDMTSSHEAVQLQRYGDLTNGVIERYKELHAEIEKLLDF